MIEVIKKLWRPLLGWQFVLTMLVNYAVLLILGYDLLVLPEGYWSAHLIVMPVLVAGRSWEKVNGKDTKA